MAGNEVPLSLTIKAVDGASGPLSKIRGAIKSVAGARKEFAGVGSSFAKVGKEAFSLGAKIAGIGVAGGVGLFAMAHSAVEAGDKLGEMAERTGLAVDAFAGLQFAAAQADVDQKAFNGSMDAFNKSVGQAKTGTGRFLAFLKKASPALAEQVQHTKSNEEALTLMANAFEKVKDPAKRAALSVAAFGDPQMGVFFAQGNKSITEQVAAFQKLSGSKKQFAERAGVLDNTLKKTAVALLGVRDGMMNELFPAFNRMAIMLTVFVTKNREGIIKWAHEANGAFQAWANSGGFERLITGLKDLYRPRFLRHRVDCIQAAFCIASACALRA
jgi:hypothetical protein